MEASMQAGAGGARTQDLIATVSAISNSLMNEVSKVIIGKNENLRRVTVGILSNGNMLLEDFPGLAKTLLANTFARALGCKFKRVQFTPDLLPSDIMGTYMYDQKSGEFKLRAGPLSPTFSSLTRSTVHLQRHRLLCLRPWKRSKSRLKESPTNSPLRSLFLQRRIPLSRRGPIRFLKRKWTAF